MRKEDDRKNEGKKTEDRKKILLLVGVVIILLLLILILVRRSKNKEIQASLEQESIEASISESKALAASQAASIAEAEAAVSKVKLDACTDEEINRLITDYFSMRLAADVEGLYALFGRDASNIDEAFATKITAQKSWVRSFDDIEVYLLPGKDENEKLGIVKYKINFRRVNTKAPCIMYFYVRKAEDGSWKLEENLLKDTRDLLSDEFDAADVQKLIDENTEKLREALANDSDLALMYVSFQNGEIYSETNLDPDREQQIDLFVDPADSILLQ